MQFKSFWIFLALSFLVLHMQSSMLVDPAISVLHLLGGSPHGVHVSIVAPRYEPGGQSSHTFVSGLRNLPAGQTTEQTKKK